MKKFLIGLGAVFLVLIIIIGCMIGFVAVQGNGSDAESKAYLEDVIPKILSNLTVENATPYMDEDVLKTLSPATTRKVFAAYSRLGAFKSYSDLKGSSNIFVNQNGKRITANYTAKAEFQNGHADVNFQIIKKGNQWKLYSMYINSDALLPDALPPAPLPSPAQLSTPPSAPNPSQGGAR